MRISARVSLISQLLFALVLTVVQGNAAFALDEQAGGGSPPPFESIETIELHYDPVASQILSLYDRIFECHYYAGGSQKSSGAGQACERRGPCQEATIRCLSPEKLRRELERQGLASCDAVCSISSCEVYFTEAWCKRLGLKDGKKMSPADLRTFVENHPPTNVREAVENCTVQHERKHLEQDARDKPICVLEQEAYWEQTQCLESYRSLLCRAGQECTHNCLMLKVAGCESETVRALNGCSCQIEPGWCSRCAGKQCDKCQTICSDNFSQCNKSALESCGATLVGVDIGNLCNGHTDSYCRRRV